MNSSIIAIRVGEEIAPGIEEIFKQRSQELREQEAARVALEIGRQAAQIAREKERQRKHRRLGRMIREVGSRLGLAALSLALCRLGYVHVAVAAPAAWALTCVAAVRLDRYRRRAK